MCIIRCYLTYEIARILVDKMLCWKKQIVQLWNVELMTHRHNISNEMCVQGQLDAYESYLKFCQPTHLIPLSVSLQAEIQEMLSSLSHDVIAKFIYLSEFASDSCIEVLLVWKLCCLASDSTIYHTLVQVAGEWIYMHCYTFPSGTNKGILWRRVHNNPHTDMFIFILQLSKSRIESQ